jgi:LIVCS family branched-chain amino acid:cation transporter
MGLEGDRWFMVVLFITMVASFFVSLLDFKGIAGFLGPILDVSYPSLIALTFMSTALRGMRWLKITIFYAVMVFMLV